MTVMRGAGLLLAALLTLSFGSAPHAPAAAAPSSPAFLAVDLPRTADLTSYHWCEGLGCGQPVLVRAATAADVFRAISRVVPVGGTSVVGAGAYGFGALATTVAVRRLQAGGPPSGDKTVVATALLGTPTRPNGGAVTRLVPQLSTPPSNFGAFSDDPVIPADPVGTSFVDVARAYDGITESPAWANVFAIANAAAGALLLRDYGGTVTWTVDGNTYTAPTTWPVTLPTTSGPVYAYAVDPQTGDRTDVMFPEPVGLAVVPEPGAADQTVYYTVYTETLPLLMPLQAPFAAINEATGSHLQNPLVQVLQPALTILVNLGYTDVDQQNGYLRTLMEPDDEVPFRVLPGAEFDDVDWRRVPHDVARALTAGIIDAVVNPFNIFGTGVGPAAEPADPALNTRAPGPAPDGTVESASWAAAARPTATPGDPPYVAVEPNGADSAPADADKDSAPDVDVDDANPAETDTGADSDVDVDDADTADADPDDADPDTEFDDADSIDADPIDADSIDTDSIDADLDADGGAVAVTGTDADPDVDVDADGDDTANENAVTKSDADSASDPAGSSPAGDDG